MLNKFLEIIRSKLGCGYVYGSQGEIMSTVRLQQLIGIHGSKHYYFEGYDAEKWIGKQCFDCSGLIVFTLQELGLVKKNQDYNADMMYNTLCDKLSGREQLHPGDLCFYQNENRYKTHVAVYIGNGKVIHAGGTKYGVVETVLFPDFVAFGRLKVMQIPYSDIEGHWAADVIRKAIAEGWAVGYKDGTFKPDKPITRAEAVALVMAMAKAK